MQNQWSEQQLEGHAKAARKASRLNSVRLFDTDRLIIPSETLVDMALLQLREARKETAMMVPDLEELVPYVHACCSDDESVQGDQASDSPAAGFRKRLTCHVLQLPWRGMDVERVIVYLDGQKITHDESSPTKSNCLLGRTRKRMQNGTKSTLPAPLGLPIDFYDTHWLSQLSPLELTSLDIDVQPALEGILARLQ